MAQIKKIVKPGDLIRGAKVGPAALDKDGNVITLKDLAANAGKVLTVNSDGTVSFQDVPSEFPDGAQTGDVLAWGGDTGAEWRPHYPESGREGDVLTLGETGPEWSTPSGGTTLYAHCMEFAHTAQKIRACAYLITASSTPFTKDTLRSFLSDNLDNKGIPATGSFIASDNNVYTIVLLYRRAYSTSQWLTFQGMKATASNDFSYSNFDADSNLVLTDTVYNL